MDEFIEEAVATGPAVSPRASHKITITHGATKFVYWYVKGAKASRGFDKTRDMELVKLMHAKGCVLRPGYFESFSIGNGRDYHLKHVGLNEFEIESLRN